MLRAFHLLPLEVTAIASILFAYLLGCICFAYYYVRFRTGRDIRKEGTGNPGARNAGIVTGNMGFITTLVGDVFKGALAVAVPIYAGLDSYIVGFCLFFVVVGHIYPVQMSFRGGKGVAALIGALLVMDFRLALGLAVVTAVAFLFFRGVTKSGLVGISSLIFIALIIKSPPSHIVSIAASSCLILAIHKVRIARAAEKDRCIESSPLHRCFKLASEPWEFEQIHRLNYKTFVEEIPQHDSSEEKRLVDKFHDQNRYVICVEKPRVIGMLALRNERPFSLDEKLQDVNSHLPPHKSLCEVRLLAVEKGCRRGGVFQGLLRETANYCIDHGHDLLVISGTVRQIRLYHHMGFSPFGPLVGTPDAQYQPMFGVVSDLINNAVHDAQSMNPIMYMLPGPVNPTKEVQRAFCEPPVSHRSRRFVEDIRETKQMLCDLVNADRVSILSGSGTLANDVIASHLSLRDSRGLILSNGEFGERLLDHAGRCGLRFQKIQKPWGEAFDYDAIESVLAENPDLDWIWFSHCETSTGMLNDLSRLQKTSFEQDIRLCVDAISSIGTVPVDLRDVYLASGVSNKGLASLPGLSFVFENGIIEKKTGVLPRYLDLSCYEGDDVPYTMCSNMIYALKAALAQLDPKVRYADINRKASWLRTQLRASKFNVLCADETSSPAVTTVVFSQNHHSEEIGNRLEQSGILVSYKSEYLLKRNWMQICFMGTGCSLSEVSRAVDELRGVAGVAVR